MAPAGSADTARPDISQGVAPPTVITLTKDHAPRVVKAQNPSVSMDSSKAGVPFFTNYGTEQGLALSVLVSGFADKKGNLWFGSQGGGVSKYDGKSFTNYTMLHGLAYNIITCITDDYKGNLWFGTNGGGVSKYDGRKFTNYTTADGLASNTVWTIFEDRSGRIWFGTEGSGISMYDGRKFTNFTEREGLAGNLVWSIAQDRIGDLWFGTSGKGASRYDGKKFTNYTVADGLIGNDIRSMILDNQGNLWFGTMGEGISKYDGERFVNYSRSQGFPNDNVLCMMQDKLGNIWIGSFAGGAFRFDGKRFKQYLFSKELSAASVVSIIEDKSGNLWFSTYGAGVTRYDGTSFADYTATQALGSDLIFSITQDSKRHLWLGTQGGGAIRFDGHAFANFSVPQGLPSSGISGVWQSGNGDIWFGTDKSGFCKYDDKTYTYYTSQQGLISNDVLCILQDKNHDTWIGTDSGASRFDGQSFTNFTTSQGLAANYIYNMLQDKDGHIWFATYGGGVSRFDGKSFTSYSTAQGLAGNSVTCLLQDRYGKFWFATDGRGVSRFDGRAFTTYTTASGLPDNSIYAMVEDSIRNMIWLGTNKGLVALKLDVQGRVAAFEQFNTATGYPLKDVNSNALLMDDGGALWIGCGNNRLIRFDYGALNRNLQPLSLSIQNVQVNNEDICWNALAQDMKMSLTDSQSTINEMATTFGQLLATDVIDSMKTRYQGIRFDSIAKFYPVPYHLVVPYRDNNLAFQFAAIEPAMPRQVKYQYKLEGYDKDWSPLSNSNSAAFGNIGEGDYQLKIRALSPFGAWSETAYGFRVLPPWQRTWWAYSLFLLLFVTVFWALIVFRSRTLTQKNRMLEERVDQRTAELQHSLKELKSTQKQLIQSEKMASLGELMAGIAHEIQNPLNFVNNFSELSKELVDEMLVEADKGNLKDMKTVGDDLQKNLEKIAHHGQRADAIVKGMLQHSRTSSGQKEMTDLNLLADEYLRLAYHGLRAKEKDFNVHLKTDFDGSMGKISLVAQDVGRVLLNLYTNAFYAVNEKRMHLHELGTDGSYEPTVTVSTRVEDSPSRSIEKMAVVMVYDNGNGIPEKILDKIFQPFYTTKPAGQGTGLGLSLSYDIIKAHGGSITVDTQEGAYSTFVVRLPF